MINEQISEKLLKYAGACEHVRIALKKRLPMQRLLACLRQCTGT